jgi:hypothetical protein
LALSPQKVGIDYGIDAGDIENYPVGVSKLARYIALPS